MDVADHLAGEVAMVGEVMIEDTIGVDTLLEAEVTVEAIEADREATLHISCSKNDLVSMYCHWGIARLSKKRFILETEGAECLDGLDRVFGRCFQFC